jgi:CxxC motif-containing protein
MQDLSGDTKVIYLDVVCKQCKLEWEIPCETETGNFYSLSGENCPRCGKKWE